MKRKRRSIGDKSLKWHTVEIHQVSFVLVQWGTVTSVLHLGHTLPCIYACLLLLQLTSYLTFLLIFNEFAKLTNSNIKMSSDIWHHPVISLHKSSKRRFLINNFKKTIAKYKFFCTKCTKSLRMRTRTFQKCTNLHFAFVGSFNEFFTNIQDFFAYDFMVSLSSLGKACCRI